MITSQHLDLKGISHGFFTRIGGASEGVFASLNCGLGSGDDVSTVLHNRAQVAESIGVPEANLVSAYQVHSNIAKNVTAPWNADNRPKVDALVTSKPNHALGILTADCGPVLFADAKARVIGAAHAGWKGALTGVTGSAIAEMERQGAKRENIIAVLGPTISQQAYEVGPEFPKPFLEEDKANASFFIPSQNAEHFMFDLPAYLMRKMQSEGLKKVYDLGLCTYTYETQFYSYRRATHRKEKDYGRLISAIALV